MFAAVDLGSNGEVRAGRRDRRDDAVLDCMRRFAVDEQRAARTAAMASLLYGKMEPRDGGMLRLLAWACMLHEAGQAVSHTNAHKHAAYIVEHADLPGFTAREQRVMGLLLLGQKGNLHKIGAALAEPDVAKALLAIRLAVMAMHARIDADIDLLAPRMKSRIEITAPRAWLRAHPLVACWFENESECWAEADVDFVVRQVDGSEHGRSAHLVERPHALGN